MVSKSQTVKFEAYQACNGEKNVVDISDLLFKILGEDSSKREVTLYGMPVRIDKVEELTLDDNILRKYPGMKLIYFHMSKLRDDGIAITKKNIDALSDLNLEADEYIAEDISCIFDTEHSILFVQRNFHSLSPIGIQNYLKEMKKKIDGKDFNLEFIPVQDRDMISKLKKIDNVRKLDLSFAREGYKQFGDNLNKVLGPIGEIFDNVGSGLNITLTLSAGRKKNKIFNKKNTLEMIEEISDNSSIFSKALVSGKTGSMPVEKYDLINGKLYTKYKFSSIREIEGTEKKMHLNPNSVRDVMKKLYLDRATEAADPFIELVTKNLR